MRKLNSQYRGVNKPTDVLAIEDPKFPGDKKNFMGEIYLNPSYLKSKPYDIHYILVHGLLHLSGFTHQGKSDNMKMEKKEKEILKWLEHRY
ncbi:MAG: rRNA maturation RNase YbeY [Candidatus Colwellbacteria bacterium]|nr:rRNA maturation RNase YbeY [Candidatus Colwellbacteria bacterium]